MIPIALGSVTALAIFFERLWTLRRASIIPPRLVPAVTKLIHAGKYDDAIGACDRSPSPLARVLRACLRYRSLGRGDIKEAVQDAGRREVSQMGRLIEALGAIATISPLLGLLGTVTGMIQAFRQVVTASARGAIDPSRLANGIWEALITTAAGLSVAILAYIAYRYLNGRATRLAAEMEMSALTLLDEVTGIGSEGVVTTSQSESSETAEGDSD